MQYDVSDAGHSGLLGCRGFPQLRRIRLDGCERISLQTALRWQILAKGTLAGEQLTYSW
jgi:hypothetical protein